jgi:hypothetical protein
VTDDKLMIGFPTDVAPSDVVSTTTILARLFLELDAARATSTPSRRRRAVSEQILGQSRLC